MTCQLAGCCRLSHELRSARGIQSDYHHMRFAGAIVMRGALEKLQKLRKKRRGFYYHLFDAPIFSYIRTHVCTLHVLQFMYS